jgi:hypothetical protein
MKLIHIIIIFVIMSIGSNLVYSQTRDPWSGGNCTANTASHFTFTVEPKIQITVDQSHGNLGGICPGCGWELPCGTSNYWLEYYITGGLDCQFNIIPSQSWNNSTGHIRLDYNPLYFDGAKWQVYTAPNPGDHLSFYNWQHGYGEYLWRAWICDIWVDCYTAPGLYTITHTVEVDYTCPGRI